MSTLERFMGKPLEDMSADELRLTLTHEVGRHEADNQKWRHEMKCLVAVRKANISHARSLGFRCGLIVGLLIGIGIGSVLTWFNV